MQASFVQEVLYALFVLLKFTGISSIVAIVIRVEMNEAGNRIFICSLELFRY